MLIFNYLFSETNQFSTRPTVAWHGNLFCGLRLRFQLHCGGQPLNNLAGNGVCRPAWENRLTVSALMTPTNKPTFAGALLTSPIFGSPSAARSAA